MVRLLVSILAIAVLFQVVSPSHPGPAPDWTIEHALPGQHPDQPGHDDHPCSITSCATSIAMPGGDGISTRRRDSQRYAVMPEKLSLRGIALSGEPPVPRLAG
jgi:hypothetical protein